MFALEPPIRRIRFEIDCIPHPQASYAGNFWSITIREDGSPQIITQIPSVGAKILPMSAAVELLNLITDRVRQRQEHRSETHDE